MSKSILSQSLLVDLLDYDPVSGIFIWKNRRDHYFKCRKDAISWNNKHSGRKAGTEYQNPNGNKYVMIGIFGRRYRAHRLAWIYVYGYSPNQIDHQDGNGMNNAIENLRNVDGLQNSKNQKLCRLNKSGCPGVHWRKTINKWCVRIGVGGNRIVIGVFDDKDEAIKAKKDAEALHGFHKNHGSSR